MTLAILLAWAAIVLLGFACAGMALQIATLTRDLGGMRSRPPRNRPAGDSIESKFAVLAFLSRDCLSCRDAFNFLVELPDLWDERLSLSIILKRRDEMHPYRRDAVTIVADPSLFEAWDVTLTPTLVLLGPNDEVIMQTLGGSASRRDAFVLALREALGATRAERSER